MSDVIPFVDKHYRTIPDHDHRAIAGLSIGGAQSAFVGLNHLDDFSYVAMFSAGLPLLPGALRVVPIPVGVKLRGPGLGQELDLTEVAKDFPDLKASSNAKLHQLYISCGKDDGLMTANQQFMDWQTSKGLPIERCSYLITLTNGHSAYQSDGSDTKAFQASVRCGLAA